MISFVERLKSFAGDELYGKLLDSLPEIEQRGELQFWQESLLSRFEKETGMPFPQDLTAFIKELTAYESAQDKSMRDAYGGKIKQKISASINDFDKVLDCLTSKSELVGRVERL